MSNMMDEGNETEQEPRVSSRQPFDEDNSENCGNALDAILVRIGGFGRFQMFNYVLLCMPMIFNAFQSISYVFTASPVTYRCNITYCDSLTSGYWEPWINFSIPKKNSHYDPCNRYIFIPALQQKFSLTPISTECIPEHFSTRFFEKCSRGFKFRTAEHTAAKEFGPFCSGEWKLALAGTVNNAGKFIGIPLGGLFADKFGRRNMLAVAGFLSSIMGLIQSYSINYFMFLSFELLDMVVGSTLSAAAFLLAIELVGPQRRVMAATIITISYSFGEAMLGILAYMLQNWRVLLRALYIPAALHIFLLIFLPESVRWLLSQGKEQQAVKILIKAARINGKVLPESSLENLTNSNKITLEKANVSSNPLWQAVKVFFWRITNCSFCWFTLTLISLGLSLHSVNLGGNKYNNFVYTGLVQIPGAILPIFIMNKIGGRYSLCGSMLLCAICMSGTILFAKSGQTIQLILFLIGKCAITCSFQILYFFTSEIFPTNVSNSLASICSMIGRIGYMLAPQTRLLIKHYEYAPQMIFAAFALISGCLTLFFPETSNRTLSSTMDETCNLRNIDGREMSENDND